MIKLWPQLVFAILMLGIGIIAVFFTDEVRSAVLKLIGEKKGLFSLINSSSQSRWSIRFGGVVSLVIGSFVLWMSLRNC